MKIGGRARRMRDCADVIASLTDPAPSTPGEHTGAAPPVPANSRIGSLPGPRHFPGLNPPPGGVCSAPVTLCKGRAAMQVAKNKVVAIDYTLTNPQGEVLDSSQGGEPLAYLHGTGHIIPGLERALEGRNIGEELNVTIPPDQAYGVRDEGLVQELPRTMFGDPGRQITPGMQFQGRTAQGMHLVTVAGVSDDGQTVRIDANHPLAGQTLVFNVKVVDVRDATQEEIDHGHAHGAGGHHH
jgi:FKBP-type peptidyl-prolyl cis-trans isomerase SlyD